MKYKFTLTPQTVKVFMKRLDVLMSKTGMLVENGRYNGQQKIKGMLAKQGVKDRLIIPVVNTHPSYIDQSTYSYDSYPSMMKIGAGEGLIIRINDDCCMVLYWGQKVKFAPNKITVTGSPNMPSYRKAGLVSSFKPYHDVERGKRANEETNRYAKAYWNEVAEDMSKIDYFDF